MQTIYLDISNKGAIPTIHAKQGDVGRKFLAVITDSGVPHSLDSDDLFSVWYDGDSGEGNYSEIDGRSAFSINGNKIVVELVTQMLTNPGNGVLSLVINDPTGQQIGLWNIEYVVEAVPGTDSPEADQYYTAFLNAVKEMAMAGVESPSFPGCYYRVVNGETEWLNPPMKLGVEYRTAERSDGKPVYVKKVAIPLTDPGKKYAGINQAFTSVESIICTVARDDKLTYDGAFAGLTALEMNASGNVFVGSGAMPGYTAYVTVKYAL